MTTRTHRIRTAVIAGLAVITFPLTIAAGCENEGDESPGVEQNDEQDDDEDD